ncbi:hypothetical protein QBC39DRAFT_26404 [Podospora conica]|nr:hypothetical protein QBC39DRAFT_26404 [Schizothecium conicum]
MQLSRIPAQLSSALILIFLHLHPDLSAFTSSLLGQASLTRFSVHPIAYSCEMIPSAFATAFAGSWDRLMDRMTGHSNKIDSAPILPIVDAIGDDWSHGATASIHLAAVKAKSAFSQNTTPTLAPSRLDTKPIVIATDQDTFPPALQLPPVSEAINNWAGDLESMLLAFNSSLYPDIIERAPTPAPIIEAPGVISDDDLSECDSSASDSSFDSLFDSPVRIGSPHTDTFTSYSSSPPAQTNDCAALVLATDPFILVPCTLDPRPGDIHGRKVSGFLTFPNINYQKPEDIDDEDSESVFENSCHELEAWNGGSFSGATLAGCLDDGALDKAENEENTCVVPNYAVEIYSEDTVGKFSAMSAGSLDQQQAQEQDIPLLELFEQRRLADEECPITSWVESAPGLLTMGEQEDESNAKTFDQDKELDAVFQLEWAKYQADYDADPETLGTPSACQALAVIPEEEQNSSADGSFVINLEDDENEDL